LCVCTDFVYLSVLIFCLLLSVYVLILLVCMY